MPSATRLALILLPLLAGLAADPVRAQSGVPNYGPPASGPSALKTGQFRYDALNAPRYHGSEVPPPRGLVPPSTPSAPGALRTCRTVWVDDAAGNRYRSQVCH
ncbi:hypothetical protein [Prosthecomicrobium hirschii]|uniref:hypothetical protein n=1 Tax=Prosthecodimorpha hirschii TaxID=665126 RepID=UPI00221FF40C|nr:hypothetical protein [Prosthecomicrobium hirschii]MCW1839046.1 hypothetical protein [Prosthecomicrobium hirschii]